MNEEKVLSPMAQALGITDSEAKPAFISAYCCENVEDPAAVFSALLHLPCIKIRRTGPTAKREI